VIVKLTHPFLRRCIDPIGLLKECSKFSTFAYRLEKQAIKKATGGDGEIDDDILNKYKGDGFELFVEMLVRIFGGDMLIGIDPESYELIDSEDDYGVDSVGLGTNGKIHTIQIKYRQANYELTANKDHLTNFRSLSTMSKEAGGFGVDPNEKCQLKNGRDRIKDTCNMTIIHCGKKIHYDVKEHMLSDVREVNRSDIRRRVDDNGIFWNSFAESWKNQLRKRGDSGQKKK